MSQEIPIQETLQEGPIKESNTNNTFIEGLLKIVLNYKEASQNNNMAYGYYQKFLRSM